MLGSIWLAGNAFASIHIVQDADTFRYLRFHPTANPCLCGLAVCTIVLIVSDYPALMDLSVFQ